MNQPQQQQQQQLPGSLALSNVSPATRLLEKRRQMFEVQEALEAAKQEFARKVRMRLAFGVWRLRVGGEWCVV